MMKVYYACFLMLGSILASVKNTHQDAVWPIPESFALGDRFEDLMTSSSERRPFLMFASSQKHSENHSTPQSNDKQTVIDKTTTQSQAKPNTKEKIPTQPLKKNSQPHAKSRPYNFTPRSSRKPTRYLKIRPHQRSFGSDSRHTVRFMPPPHMGQEFRKTFHPSTTESINHSLNRTPNKPVVYTPTTSNTDRIQQSLPTHFQYSDHSDSNHQPPTNQATHHNPENENSYKSFVTLRPEFDRLGPRYELEGDSGEGRKFLIFHATPIATGREMGSQTFNNHQNQMYEIPSNQYHHIVPPYVNLDSAFKHNLQDPRSPIQTLLLHNPEAPPIVIDLVPFHEAMNSHPDMSNHRLPPPPLHQDKPISPKDPHQISASSSDSVRNNLQEKPKHRVALLHQVQKVKNFDIATEKHSALNDLPYLEPEIITSATSATPAATTFRPLSPPSPIVVVPPPRPAPAIKKGRVNKKKITTKKSKISVNFDHFTADDSPAQNVPGRPGIDYPIFSEIPFTNFECQEFTRPGFYADLEAGCQIFHNCDTTMKKHSFLCPNGTIFHQELFICDWWYNVNCDDSPHFYNLNAGLYVGPSNEKQKTNRGERKSS